MIAIEETNSAWVTMPTISKLRVALDEMQAAGVPEDSPLTIAHLANALGTFVIRELKGQTTPSEDAEPPVVHWGLKEGSKT